MEESSPILRPSVTQARVGQPPFSIRRKPLNTNSSFAPQLFPRVHGGQASYKPLYNESHNPNDQPRYEGSTDNNVSSIQESHFDSDHRRERPPSPVSYDNIEYGSDRSPPLIQVSTAEQESLERGHGEEYVERQADGQKVSIFRSSSDWKPISLRFVGTFCLILVAHLMLYLVGYQYTKHHPFYRPELNWFFQFAPSFLAVLFKEICTRLAVDYMSISAYFPEYLVDQKHVSPVGALRAGPKLYSMSIFKNVLLNSRFTIVEYLASLLILVQSTIMSSTYTPIKEDTRLLLASPDGFLSAYQNTSIPALAVPAAFLNQSIDAYKWIGSMANDDDAYAASGLGILPFRIDDQSPDGESLTGTTSAYANAMGCEQIVVPVVDMRKSGATTWDVAVDLTDSLGCHFQLTTNNVPLTGQTNFSTGAVGNDTFALWKFLRDGQAQEPSSTCPGTKQFLLAGQISEPDLPSTSDGFLPVKTRAGQAWTALSCTAHYIEFNHNIEVTIYPGNQNMNSSNVWRSGAKDVNSSVSTMFDDTMKRNFMDNDLIYSLGSMLWGETFWGAPASKTFFGDDFGSDLDSDFTCASLEGTEYSNIKTFTTLEACKMFSNLQQSWPLWFSLSVPVTASYLPAESWAEVGGSIGRSQNGWVVSKGTLFLSGLVHFLMVFFLVSCRMIHLPGTGWLPSYIRGRLIGHKRSGLKGSPSTIIAKAELFSSLEVRSVFAGVDALHKDEAGASTRRRIEPLKFRPRITKYSSRESETIELTPRSPRPARLEQKPLTHIPAELSHMRFAFKPRTVHPVTLCGIFIVMWAIFAGGVWMSQHDKGYHLWQLPVRYGSDLKTSFLVMAQELAFNVLPTVILLILRAWWTDIDTFFRASQPYVGLYHSWSGKHSVCLKYINDIDVLVTIKALKNQHFRLAFITVITFLVKLALALAGGLFYFRPAISSQITPVEPLQLWRNNTYQADADSFDTSVLQSTIIYSILGSSNDAGWQVGNYLFPAVKVDDGQYSIELQGMTASLDCQEIKLSSSQSNDKSLIVVGPEKIEWPKFCAFDVEVLQEDSAKTMISTKTSTSSTSSATSTRTSSSQTTSLRTTTTTALSPLPRPTTTTPITSTSSTSRVVLPAPAPTRPGTTEECYEWYTPQPGDYCWEIADKLGFGWERLRVLNTDIDAGCLNLQPFVSYCVDGVQASAKSRREVQASSAQGGCTGWKYLDPDDTNSTFAGQWWLVDAHGPIAQNASSVIRLSSITESTSLLCKPRYYMNTVNATIDKLRGEVSVSVQGVLHSRELTDHQFAEDSSRSLTLSNYFSSSLTKYGFAGRFNQLSETYFLDDMSLIAASNSTQLTSAFKNTEEFKRIASFAFGLVFATAANRTISPDGSSLLLQSVDPDSSIPTINAYQHIRKAYVAQVPLYATMIILALYAIALLFAYPDRSRRMALDPSAVANVITSIYDSSIIKRVQEIVQRGENPLKELENERFAYGVFFGESGQRRLGIDFADRVTPVSGYVGSMSDRIRRRVPWRRTDGLDADAEKQSLAGSCHSDVPELAQCQSPRELATRGDYHIPVIRYNSLAFRQQEHGAATETGYEPVDMSQEHIADPTIGLEPRKKRSWDLIDRWKRKKKEPIVSVRERSGYSSPEAGMGHQEGFWYRLKQWLKGPLADR